MANFMLEGYQLIHFMKTLENQFITHKAYETISHTEIKNIGSEGNIHIYIYIYIYYIYTYIYIYLYIFLNII